MGLSSDINTKQKYPRSKFSLTAGNYKLNLGTNTRIMGILNITPDSFSGDGLYKTKTNNPELRTAKIIEAAEKMAEDGADIIDVGGESTRPNAEPIAQDEEIKRVIPVIKLLSKKIALPISIDTYKPEVAEQALDNGASIVNDITAISSQKMGSVIKKYNAAVVLMHMRGNPSNMQDNPEYADLISEIASFLSSAVRRAMDAGISKSQIIIDPGIGFGKTPAHNLEIINRLGELRDIDFPILAGPSRKSFIGHIIDKKPGERLFGTSAAIAMLIANGIHIVRVHDVGEISDVVKVSDAILNSSHE